MGKHTKKENKIRKIVIWAIVICMMLGVTVSGAALYLFNNRYLGYAENLINNTNEEVFHGIKTSNIYYSNGKLMAKLSDQDPHHMTYIDYDDIPENVINAFIAVEDRSFWDNSGISVKGLARVAYRFIKTSGTEVHGASTITQQLARNIFLTHEVSIERKLKEIAISFKLTEKYTKQQIMEYYINNIYYSNGCYGVDTASYYYFNKSVKDLTLSQCAFLCAIPNSPTYYDPLVNFDNTISRRNKILYNMNECGYISDEELEDSLNEEIKLSEKHKYKDSYPFNNYETTYAEHCAIEYLMDLAGFKFKYTYTDNKDYNDYKKEYNKEYAEAKKELYSGHYEVYTSLDRNIQKRAQKVVNDKLSVFKAKGDDGEYLLQGAATVIDNETNKVVAIVGGRKSGQKVYSLNRGFQSYRQPGSSIKPLVVYTPALEIGYTPYTILKESNVSAAIKMKDPKKAPITGSINFTNAVALSRNGAAWWLFGQQDIVKNVNKLNSMNFKSIVPSDYVMAASLGGLTYGTNTTEMAGAYNCIENKGQFTKPTCITSILKDGVEIYKESEPKRVYKSSAAKQMAKVMESVVNYGTAARMNWYSTSRVKAAGKTGTTDNNKDAWFCGFTPYYTVSVWCGYDKPQATNSLWGNTYPVDIWKAIMSDLVADKEPVDFGYFSKSTIDEPDDTSDMEELLPGYSKYVERYYKGYNEDYEISRNYTVGNLRRDMYELDKVKELLEKYYQETNQDNKDILMSEIEKHQGFIYGTMYKNQCNDLINSYIDKEKESEIINSNTVGNEVDTNTSLELDTGDNLDIIEQESENSEQ